ncbi:MAG: acyl-CoA thioesterase [Bryobacterales bacterium]|nr:acyl-CoA thioesterase [Bryobacterales bacterium]
MLEYETRLRVRYAETDQMGVAYYANYIVWMEVGRTELCRSLGIRYRDMEAEEGILLVVAEVHCRYLSPARYDDEIGVSTRIAGANFRMVTFGYEIRHIAEARLLAKGETRHVFCGRDFRPRKLPPKYHAFFGIGVK